MIIRNNNSIDIIQGNNGYGNAEGITDWRLENRNTGVFNILNSSLTTSRLTIIENGNVGIGTVPTSSKLDINADINISGNYKKNNSDIISDTSNYVLSTSNILSTNILNSINKWATNSNMNNMIYYNNTPILPNFITSSPTATTNSTVGTDRYMSFTYTTDNVSGLVGQTQYTINIPTGGITCDILIVGGGGGGGNAIYNSSHEPGGGGAGGVVYMVNKNLSAGTYKINVGNGGAGNTNGNNSSITDNNNNTLTFDNILLIGKGGGKGATGHQTVGSDGGSGGGGGHDRANGGTGTQGNTFWNGTTYIAGGNNGAKPGGSSSGGGGGGAGEAGDTDGGGSGGDGVQVNITGTNTFYAGGGNAYYNTSTTRSDGGGGTLNGTGSQQNGGSALPNTGSGGSGAYLTSSSTTGGSGGSGIIIIRIINIANVGIGTTNPISKLHLFDNTINETKLTIQNNFHDIREEIISSPAAYISGTITNSTDRYMIFTSSSSFTIPTGGINCDIFMIGGGGGGNREGGGGGAGACIVAINQTLPNGTCSVVVGGGGTWGSVYVGNNTNGGESSISVNGTPIYLAKGGGLGGGSYSGGLNGRDGGCGGGSFGVYNENNGNGVGGNAVETNIVVNSSGSIITSSPTNTPSTYAIFGNKGGGSWGGGGGGIGAVGGTYKNSRGGNGLYQAIIGGNLYNFREYFANGSTTFGVNDGTGNYYIGGGGGAGGSYASDVNGSGGLGGGGDGRTPQTAGTTQGKLNTGSGGGGGAYYGGNGSGGSGIVIIRYRCPSTLSSIELINSDNINYIEPIIPGTTVMAIPGTLFKYILFPLFPYTNTTTKYTFTATEDINCEILVVGGGGAGGNSIGGGGGAGAVVYIPRATLYAGSYTISVGNGGVGTPSGASANGIQSSISGSFGSIIAEGGGGTTGGHDTGDGSIGGSGGGAAGPNQVLNYGGAAGTSSFLGGFTGFIYGNRGGNNTTTRTGNITNASGGGGAGSAAADTNPNGTAGGNGGAGILINITGNNNYYGGGGGGSGYAASGGSGGIGGGGNGGIEGTVGYPGAPNTGGGGGGGGWSGYSGGSGGSGVVIIRYLITKNLTTNTTNYKIGNYNGDFIVKSSINGTDNDNIKITGATNAITNPTGTTSWTTASDRRIKENIERASYDKCYESINKLELNRFNYINGFNTVNRDITQLGFIAQEVKEIFPKSVFENSYVNNNINISDLQSIDITQINYTLYGAVKKLIEIINDDEEKIKKLESILNIDIDKMLTSNIDISSTSNIDIDSISIITE